MYLLGEYVSSFLLVLTVVLKLTLLEVFSTIRSPLIK